MWPEVVVCLLIGVVLVLARANAVLCRENNELWLQSQRPSPPTGWDRGARRGYGVRNN